MKQEDINRPPSAKLKNSIIEQLSRMSEKINSVDCSDYDTLTIVEIVDGLIGIIMKLVDGQANFESIKF